MVDRILKRALPIAALGLGALLSGCSGNANVTINGQDGVPLSELDMGGSAPDELVVSGGDKVIVTEGDALDITVEGDEDSVAALRFVRDGDMIGVTREDGWNSKGAATVRITMATPRELVIGGSGEIETPAVAKDAEATIGGSGKIQIGELDADSLEVAMGGNGEITASGKVKKLEISIGGSGTVNFDEVMADDVEISIGGSGDVALQSNGTVEASIGGSGDINVTGSAKCSLSSFGSGTLNCRPAETASPAEDNSEATEE